jgi:hypothetical protein
MSARASLTRGRFPNYILGSAMKPILALLALIISCYAVGAQSPRAVLKVGDRAPEFVLPDADGKTVKLADYVARGPVVVIFYRGFW